jgi:hypothetical protein
VLRRLAEARRFVEAKLAIEGAGVGERSFEVAELAVVISLLEHRCEEFAS